jgi:hypothetical protein
MAKAKKSEAEEKPTKPATKAKAEPAKAAAARSPAQPKAVAKPAAAKKPAAKKGKKEEKAPARPAAGGTPLVDTSLAAESAARMLMGKAKLGAAAQPAPPSQTPAAEKESASFKQFKESVNKPAAHGPGKAAANPFAPKNPLPIPGSNPVFHNQTQGGVSRVNVPRRTGG